VCRNIVTHHKGRTDVEIVIGEPSITVIHVVDDATDRPVSDVKLFWNCRRPKESTGGGLEPATWDADISAFRANAPAGEVEWSIHGVEHELVSDRFTSLVAGPNEITLRVRRNCGVVLYLEDGSHRIAWDDQVQWAVSLVRVDGDLRVRGAMGGSESHGAYYVVDAPGAYRVTIPPLAGFEPIAPFEVNVPPAGFAEHVVELTRHH
jgi:hypothetical protein